MDLSQVDHVARLARLELSDEERRRFAEQLGRILEHVAALDALDTSGVEPTSHVLPMTNVLREDQVTPSLPREVVLAEAREQEDGYFKVPRVILPD
ncbi:MAG: Asp-tRNA(Asn)/Glu-tRNA(Gln) amidotransferase subunit GatC [Armatimonadetes bacterium]|nr:Asp-tRNA(Asn)/Glu-tRNA(Gln) amidotransferase subunit GatC [Armatimonadota bacterium]